MLQFQLKLAITHFHRVYYTTYNSVHLYTTMYLGYYKHPMHIRLVKIFTNYINININLLSYKLFRNSGLLTKLVTGTPNSAICKHTNLLLPLEPGRVLATFVHLQIDLLVLLFTIIHSMLKHI